MGPGLQAKRRQGQTSEREGQGPWRRRHIWEALLSDVQGAGARRVLQEPISSTKHCAR